MPGRDLSWSDQEVITFQHVTRAVAVAILCSIANPLIVASTDESSELRKLVKQLKAEFEVCAENSEAGDIGFARLVRLLTNQTTIKTKIQCTEAAETKVYETGINISRLSDEEQRMFTTLFERAVKTVRMEIGLSLEPQVTQQNLIMGRVVDDESKSAPPIETLRGYLTKSSSE